MDALFTIIPNQNINIINLIKFSWVVSGEGNVLYVFIDYGILLAQAKFIKFIFENWPWRVFYIEFPKRARHIMSVHWEQIQNENSGSKTKIKTNVTIRNITICGPEKSKTRW